MAQELVVRKAIRTQNVRLGRGSETGAKGVARCSITESADGARSGAGAGGGALTTAGVVVALGNEVGAAHGIVATVLGGARRQL